MKKIVLLAAATLTLASAGLSTAAEAGGCGNRGFRAFSHGPSVSHRYQSSSYDYQARKKARAAAIAAKKRELALKLAEKRRRIAAAKAAAAKRAEIAEARRERAAKQRLAARLAKQQEQAAKIEETAAIDPPAPEQKPDVVADAKSGSTQVAQVRELTCKRYIPSAGLTITVPCE